MDGLFSEPAAEWQIVDGVGAGFTPLCPPLWRTLIPLSRSPWKTPISAWLGSLWNHSSLFCSYSPPVAMDTAPHWFDLSVNLFISSSREWRGPFFCSSGSQSKCGFSHWAWCVITFGWGFFWFSEELGRSDRETTAQVPRYHMWHWSYEGSQIKKRTMPWYFTQYMASKCTLVPSQFCMSVVSTCIHTRLAYLFCLTTSCYR